jgi:hypothetical protein
MIETFLGHFWPDPAIDNETPVRRRSSETANDDHAEITIKDAAERRLNARQREAFYWGAFGHW